MRGQVRRRHGKGWVGDWLDAGPTLLRLVATLWITAIAGAVIRGVDFHDPLRVARNWALAGILCLAMAVVLVVVVQLIFRAVSLLRR